ncbi:tRNA (guanosine(37)-N1)-methyltransferase TrmD [Candidatus Daviesbacteria bacterium RIFCSPHIGHO2_02_FULL_36_13]|uniref:tRNA (guanine-N(1)-)-methyltransferase n=1 Tax=Candidatus Daviesbacteria bacterium RIFCSPHIGHO2_02_FULL_36_13 TaxID=1797768 RepID=A0A1F5JQ10_9BACT|nr:MAG: tRNA (guanosine(37)-N1)-methyltransferase TrmD [Candidatus Daviesbacteria bacterium RIFCSPHIGHO2_02_FULL_36_13]OGE44657.1 MAG: tRNA (guanosine(37)-N1)-methyltransferase TrmD [Candidatus Daviesbacteria bacterium RIFCSPLOWO2_01_FULL_36_8]
MIISIITLFPEMFDKILNTSILKRAQAKGKVKFKLINLREFGEGKHQIVDGRPYGGGAGMVLRADILARAVSSVVNRKSSTKNETRKTILTSASGKPYKQAKARQLSQFDHVIIICGHYEGVDQRFIEKYVTEEISIGDYVLTGGEIPAMIIADSIVRLLPGVLKKEEAVINESFSENLLEGPQYTRPDIFEGLKVPDVLTSGNHGEIDKWRKEQGLKKTKKIRPDLITQKD